MPEALYVQRQTFKIDYHYEYQSSLRIIKVRGYINSKGSRLQDPLSRDVDYQNGNAPKDHPKLGFKEKYQA